MANNGSYSNDRSSSLGDAPELAADPASGGFFHSDYKKHEDLKQMLDSNKDGLKLEAMKRIIGMVAKGRDASDLFPAVVKNVVSKSIEVKKLVYVYLVRYAEEQQDLALLSISTFQRALKDPNQLIRASALRVLSSIRVPMIVPIVMLAIKDSASDMSPYVRKTAAHAIPKLYSLDQEQKDDLVHVIEKLLSDKTTLVVGSAVMSFEEVCPERIDLIHKNYRKLCNLLVDVDEWGQVIIINMLTRYARTQFPDPNIDASHQDQDCETAWLKSRILALLYGLGLDGFAIRAGLVTSFVKNEYARQHGAAISDTALDLDLGEEEEDKPFYEDTEEEEENNEKQIKAKKKTMLNHDHRLLLKNTKPLLQSRNASVVMGVAQLYHHLAPRPEVILVARALIRLLRSHREVQSVVLNCIASISTLRKGMFQPFLKSFFVRTSDPTHIKLLKLEILTNLATESSISVILREFQAYISSHDKEFVAAAIQAIGRCASNIKEVTDSCLNGLVALLSNRDEAVVAESVVVIKKLLQTQPNEHKEIIIHMAKILDTISVPQARASILWLLGEYSDRVPKIAPDVLRKMAKSFVNEEDIVKLQIMNLAVKLFLTNPKQTKLLCQYVFSLARYDQNYDIRDRARFLRQFIFPSGGTENSMLSKHAKNIFLAAKPAPVIESKFKDREQFQLGSLSHYINSRAIGYHDLPTFPTEAPDTTVRDVADLSVANIEVRPSKKQSKPASGKKHSFYSESEQSSPADSDEEGEGEEEEEEEDSSEDSSDEDSSEEDSDEEDNEAVDDSKTKSKKVLEKKVIKLSEDEEEEDSSDEEEDSSADEEDESDSSDSPAELKKKPAAKTPPKTPAPSTPKPKSNLDLLLELDDSAPLGMTPVMTPSLGGFLSPLSAPVMPMMSAGIQLTASSFIPMKTTEILNKINGGGLGVVSRFTRSPHLFSTAMVSIELVFSNQGMEEITDIRVGQKSLSPGMSMHDFAPVSSLPVNATLPGTIGVDFNDSTQPVAFEIIANGRSCRINFKAPVGELIRSVSMPDSLFVAEQNKLKGMNEHSTKFSLPAVYADPKTISQRVFEAANVASIPGVEPAVIRFAGQTLTSKSLVLVTVKVLPDNEIALSVNCEKMVVGSMLLNEIKSSLRS